jgi:hypothetical protein
MKTCDICWGTGLTGNWQDCPTCGQMAFVPDGTGDLCEECDGTGEVEE